MESFFWSERHKDFFKMNHANSDERETTQISYTSQHVYCLIEIFII